MSWVVIALPPTDRAWRCGGIPCSVSPGLLHNIVAKDDIFYCRSPALGQPELLPSSEPAAEVSNVQPP